MTFFTHSEFLVSREHPTEIAGVMLNRGQQYIIELGVESILDPLRRDVRAAIHILSGYRTRRLNQLLHGSPASDHMAACAADITSAAGASRLYKRAIKLRLPYRQLIYYPVSGFVHVSWNVPGKRYKHESWTKRE